MEPLDVVIMLALTYATAIMLSYLQWLSDDDNFNPTYKPFGE